MAFTETAGFFPCISFCLTMIHVITYNIRLCLIHMAHYKIAVSFRQGVYNPSDRDEIGLENRCSFLLT